VVSSALRETALFPLFGVTNDHSSNALFRITWDTAAAPELFYQIDDSLEVTVSLGRASDGTTFATRIYDPAGATVLAR
jgi:hypothetical protein